MTNSLSLSEVHHAFNAVRASFDLDDKLALLAPAPEYAVGDVASALAFTLAAKERCALEVAANKIKDALPAAVRERVAIERGYLNLRIDLIDAQCFEAARAAAAVVPTILNQNIKLEWAHAAVIARACLRTAILNGNEIEVIYVPERAAEIAALRRKYKDDSDPAEWLKNASSAEKRALIFYLSHYFTGHTFDPWVPKFHETANIYWYTSETIERLERRVAQNGLKQEAIVLEGQYREALWAASVLQGFIYRAAHLGEVEQFMQHLFYLLNLLNRLCLEKQGEQLDRVLSTAIKILTSAFEPLRNTITLVSSVEQLRSVLE
jgi:hypothetical protein